MGFLAWAGDIVHGTLRRLFTRAEDPAATVDLVIAEMETTLVEVRASAVRLIAEGKDIDRTLGKLAASAAEWEERALLALSSGREDLAGAAVARKQELERMSADLADERRARGAQIDALSADIARIESLLREAQGRKSALSARIEAASGRSRLRNLANDPRLAAARASFARIEHAADRAEAEAEVFDLAPQAVPRGEDPAIAAELAALKRRLANG